MSTDTDLRAYVNPQPAAPEKAQKLVIESLGRVQTYIEGRHGEARQVWIDSIRPTSTAVVSDLFVLAKASGRKDKRYADLLVAKDDIHGIGSHILEASTGRRSNNKAEWPLMRDRAYAMLDGAVKSGKVGRPARGFTDRELEVMQAIMDSRNYTNWDQRKAAMLARGVKPPSRTWCYEKLPTLTKNLGQIIELQPAPKYKRAPSRKKLNPASVVYFVRAGDAVKIGTSIKPMERMQNLDGGNHEKLVLLAIMPGGRKEERALHKRFAEYKLPDKREWFRFNREIDKFIASIGRKSKRK